MHWIWLMSSTLLSWCTKQTQGREGKRMGERGYPRLHIVLKGLPFTDRTLVKQPQWQSLVKSSFVYICFTEKQHCPVYISRARLSIPKQDLGGAYTSAPNPNFWGLFWTPGCLSARRRDVGWNSPFVMVDCSASQTKNEGQACFQWAPIRAGYWYVWVILLYMTYT